MISVCIATFNGEKYIKKQLESILVQLSIEDEIIVTDDESTDKTLEIIFSIEDNRIKVFHNVKDLGLIGTVAASFRFAAKNFENAILKCKGDFIYLSDQDDIWSADRISKTKPYLQNNDMVMCNYAVIDGCDQIINEKYYSVDPVKRTVFGNLASTPFLGCCMAFRRSVLDYTLPFPKACVGHDLWIGCMVMHLGTYKFVNEPLHLYRKHSANVSPATGRSENSFIFKIQYRIEFIIQVFLRSLQYRIKRKFLFLRT